MKCRREATCGLHLYGESSLILGVLTRPRGPSGKRGRKTCLPQDTITGGDHPDRILAGVQPENWRAPAQEPVYRYPFLAVAMF